MNIIRYHTPKLAPWPARNRHSSLADLFDSAFSRPLVRPSRENVPAVEISEDSNQFIVRLEAVGLTKEDFEIALQDGVLTISYERAQANNASGEEEALMPRRGQSFSRSLTLSKLINSAEVNAVYQDGILTVILPKAEAAKPRKVQVTSN